MKKIKQHLAIFCFLFVGFCSPSTPDAPAEQTRAQVLQEHGITEEQLQQLLDNGQVPPYYIPPAQ